MTLQKLVSEIAKREGKKSQARIGEIREFMKILCELQAEADYYNSTGPIDVLVEHAAKAYKRVERRLDEEE